MQVILSSFILIESLPNHRLVGRPCHTMVKITLFQRRLRFSRRSSHRRPTPSHSLPRLCLLKPANLVLTTRRHPAPDDRSQHPRLHRRRRSRFTTTINVMKLKLLSPPLHQHLSPSPPQIRHASRPVVVPSNLTDEGNFYKCPVFTTCPERRRDPSRLAAVAGLLLRPTGVVMITGAL